MTSGGTLSTALGCKRVAAQPKMKATDCEIGENFIPMTRSLFFGLSTALLLLSSCASSRYTRDSGATNVLNVSFNDPEINYTEASVPLDGKSWGGILLGAQEEYAVDASIISNNNGDNTGFFNASGGSNSIAALTFIVEALSIATSMTAGVLSIGAEIETRSLAFVGLTSIFSAAAINDALWRGINQRRVQAQANTQIMDLTSDAHFYCMPQSQIVVKPRLFSTSWEGKSSLIAGKVSNVATVEGESMMGSRLTVGQRLNNEFRAQEVREKAARVVPSKNGEGAKPESIVIQPSELMGSTGQYAVSKNEYVNFTVIEIVDEGSTLSDCVIVIQFVNSKGQTEQKKVRASNDDLMYQAPGQK